MLWTCQATNNLESCMALLRLDYRPLLRVVKSLSRRRWICERNIYPGAYPAVTNDKHRHSESEKATHLDPSYCGGCYGAPPPPNAQKPGCCNTCDEVREAYASASWAFGRGDGVEQCEREGYGEKLDAQRKEGCRIEGGLRVNKVIGNFHIAPG